MMKREKYIAKLKTITHMYDTDVNFLISKCQEIGIKCENGDDGYLYFENEDFSHAIEIEEV